MSEEIIDLKEVMERVQDDKELLLELLDIFQEDFLKKREALGQAVAAGDIGKIKEVAHSIKGSSGNISAKPIHIACKQLEELAKVNSTAGMPDLLKAIDGQFVSLKAYAAKLKQEWGGA